MLYAGRNKNEITFNLALLLIKDMLKEDYKNTPFCFKFDETTTSQIKKQYDGYIQFYSESLKKVVTCYCGSLFVGHCTAEDLLDHFFHFMKNLNLDTNFAISISMDVNVNKSTEKKLWKCFNEGCYFFSFSWKLSTAFLP